MPLSYAITEATAAQDTVSVSIEYIHKSHIRVLIDGIEETDIEWTSPNQIEFEEPLTGGEEIRVQRTTPTTPLVSFSPGKIHTDDLNLLGKQLLFVAQETVEGVEAATDLVGAMEDLQAMVAIAVGAASEAGAAIASLALIVAGAEAAALAAAQAAASVNGENILTKDGNLSGLASASTARSNLGLGTVALENSPLPVNKGGTGATDATSARVNLGAAADAVVVKNTGAQSIDGVKTFTSIPVGPTADPTTGNQLARKSYVDAKTGQPIPIGTAAADFPVGTFMVLITTTSVNDGATTAGTNLRRPLLRHQSIIEGESTHYHALAADDEGMAGTWRNISGVNLTPFSGTSLSGPFGGYFVRTA